MAKTDLTFRIFGKDVSASKTLKGVGAAASSASGKLGGIGKGLGIAAVGLGGLAVAGGAVAVSLGKDAVNAASDLNETTSKVGVLFGKSAGDIEKFAANAASSLGQTKQQAMDAAATFATFGKSAGLSGGDLTGFSTQMTGLASDLASFNNTSPEEAINAIGAALRGETEPMRAYGVLMDDASMRAQALKMGLIKTTKEALTPQQKVLAAQALIMNQTKSAQGDFARTSGGLANQQRILSAEMENASASVGTALLPMITNLAHFATGSLIPAIKTVAEWLSTNLGPAIEKVGGWIQTVALPAIQKLASAFMTNVWPAIQMVAGMIAQNLQPVVVALAEFWTNTLWPAVQRLVPVLMTVAKVVGIVVGALAVAISWILGKVVPFFYKVLSPAIGIIVTVLEKVASAIGWAIDHFGEFIDFAKGIPGKIGDAFKTLVNVITWPFRTAFNAIASLWNNTVGNLSVHTPDIPGTDWGGINFSMPKIPTVSAFAKGGIITGPTLALMGERGTETVLPYDVRKGGAGGTHLHFHGPVAGPGAGRWLADEIRKAQGNGRTR